MSIIYAVHGVGSHSEGNIENALRENLAGSDIEAEVVEFNWSNLGDHSPNMGALRIGLFGQIISTLANAAFVERRSTPGVQVPTTSRFACKVAEFGQCPLYLIAATPSTHALKTIRITVPLSIDFQIIQNLLSVPPTTENSSPSVIGIRMAQAITGKKTSDAQRK